MKAGHISLTGLASEQAPVGRPAREEPAESEVAEGVWGPRASSQAPQDNAFHQVLMSVISFAARAKLLFLSNRLSLALLAPCPFDKNILKDHANTFEVHLHAVLYHCNSAFPVNLV